MDYLQLLLEGSLYTAPYGNQICGYALQCIERLVGSADMKHLLAGPTDARSTDGSDGFGNSDDSDNSDEP